ncbi:ATP-binding protein [Photobacterium sp. Alg240-V54]|uniref:ATP-binding protein n=1 Tax=Photobacterium sp. Alg240-V54 TaxID=2305995 RepID=UPI0013CF74E7|nr:ATP-binding protein [Photobacterium sp. Alg240-V54]
MAEHQLKASESGVKSKFRSTTKEQAFAEYIWNALDSGATRIQITAKMNYELDQIIDICIQDNGSGIEVTDLKSPFDSFEDSEKKNNNHPLVQGKKGRGRLSFFKFCDSARWISKHKNSLDSYEIEITSGSLNKFRINKKENHSQENGTSVFFNNMHLTISEFNGKITKYITENISWMSIIKPNINITINGEVIPKPRYILNKRSTEYVHDDLFEYNCFVWENKIRTEPSHIYISDTQFNIIDKIKFVKNDKSFFCSCIISSEWFNSCSNKEDELSISLDKKSTKFIEIEKLAKEKLTSLFLDLRKDAVEQLISEYEDKNIMPKHQTTNRAMNQFRDQQLKDTIRVIYEADSAIFTDLINDKQKKILIKLLDKIVNSENPECLFDVLDGIVSLSETEIRTFSNSLNKISMQNIIKTISHLEERLRIIDLFEDVLKNKGESYEVAHIQVIIENNMWLFGEEYNLISAEEDKFDKALRNYLEFKSEDITALDNPNEEKFHPKHYDKHTSVVHPHKYKEMDIFASQKGAHYYNGESCFRNIILELKRPSVNLTNKELNQIKEYANVIECTEEFNTKDEEWDFILVGNKISNNPQKSYEITRGFSSTKDFGKPGLVQIFGENNNIRIWVKEWSQIISDFKLKYNHIIQRLNVKAMKIQDKSPDFLVNEIKNTNLYKEKIHTK